MSRYGVSGSGSGQSSALAQVRGAASSSPPGVAIRVPGRGGDGIARPADDEDPADRRRERRGLVGDGLERHARTTSEEAVGRDEHARLAVVEPGATAGAAQPEKIGE